MARANILLSGIFFLSSFALALPANPQGNIPGDPWGFTAKDIYDSTWSFSQGDTTYDPFPTETFGTYTVTANGHDIWNPQDAFRFLYFEAEGDFSISVCVLEDPFQGGDNEWAKAGLMVRQNNSVGSADVYQVVTRNVHPTEGARTQFCCFQWRPSQDAGATWRRAEPTASQPYPFWLRIRREGQTFYGDYSDDGENWVHPSGDTAEQVVVMDDPVLVGICLTSHQDATLTTVEFTEFRFNGLGPQPRAIAMLEPDNVIYAGEEVILDGSYSLLATDYLWEQVKVGDEPDVDIPEPRPSDGITTVTPPGRDVGYVATFRLTVEGVSLEGEPGTDTDEVQVTVRAMNPPKIAPGNLHTYPMDVGGKLGFRLEWDPLIDADKYGVGEKIVEGFYFWYWTPDAHYTFSGMTEGRQITVAVKAWNELPGGGGGEGPQSEDVTYTAMRNVALASGASPPSKYVYAFSSGDITTMNNGAYNESNDSQTVPAKSEDFWGYVWSKAQFFDHIAYYTGQFSTTGGWFIRLKVQYTQDGKTWKDVPVLEISPEYDFRDGPGGRKDFVRYDISIPTVRGTGIRIYGTPGGMNTYTSIGELEVYGDQTRPAGAIVVQGLDAKVPEGSTASLDGSHSFSLTGPIVSYQWQQVSGPTVTLQNPSGALATFDAPIVDSDVVFVFSLTASDGVKSDTDEDVRITVKNLKTTAVAGPDQTVPDGSEVTLDGSGSLSTTGTLTYLWTQMAGTVVGVTGSTDSVVTFTAPVIWDYTEELTFQLQVNDQAGGTSSDEVVVTVRNSLTAPVYDLEPRFFRNILHLGQSPNDRLSIAQESDIDVDHLLNFGGEANINPKEGDAFDFTGTGWHHFAFIVNPQTNTVDIYIDGVPRSVSYYHQESPSSFSNFQYPFAIGAGYTAGAAGTFYEGFIDEVRIYHRALNEAEVRFLSGIRPPYSLGVHVSKNYQESVANITALDDSKMTIGTVAGYSSYSWIVDSGLYYLQASISHNDFIYTSEEIEVDVLGDTVVAINFPFSDLSASCVDIANQPLDDCTIIFNRENEEHTTSTNSSGLATIEAYYGNWSVEAFWMAVPVGEGHLIVNQSQTVLNLQCMVGDFTFIAVNPFGNPVEADVTLFNESFDVSLSDHHHKTQGNLTFSQIPLLTYDLTISGDFGTQNYHVDVGQTRYIRVETLPLFSKAIFIIIGVTIGILIALIGKRVFAKQETTIWR